MDATRTVCTAIPCQIAYAAEQRRLIAQSSRATRKRTPGQIHQLKKDEKNARRRAARARKRSAA
jgi:hypothetical protein